MKQENKNLLLQDLCARLPYGVKVQYQVGSQLPDIKVFNGKQYDELRTGSYLDDWLKCTFKPYLFPLSSMNEEQLNDFYAVIRPVIEESIRESREWKEMQEWNPTGKERPITLKDMACDITAVNWILERHFDIYGLIEKGLAVDATNLNIY
jgi:hypothetical protein